MAESGREAGFSHLIGFDMGGTSTDVSHFDGEYERAFETEVAGVRMRAPMMLIHTVAAGGGSLLHFDGARFRVGPDSAGANPGPKCYRRGGPLAVTDANVMVGKLIPDFFPRIFGAQQDLPLDAEAVREAFAQLAHEIGDGRSAEDTADGFIRIAVENMANAIKKISLQRGYDVTRYALNCFGGAGGQHACLVADALGMTKVLIHPFSSLLSAYGMGLADIRATRQQALEEPFGDAVLASIATVGGRLGDDARNEVIGQGVAPEAVTVHARAHIRYAGTDMALVVPAYSTGFIHADGRAAPASPPPLAGEGQGGGGHDDSGDHAPSAPLPRKRGREQAASDGETAMHAGVLNSGLSLAKMKSAFEAAHKSRFGFIDETKDLVVEAVSVEAIGGGTKFAEPVLPITGDPLPSPTRRTRFYSRGQWHDATVYTRTQLSPGHAVAGPAIVIEPHQTIVVEDGWRASIASFFNPLLMITYPVPKAALMPIIMLWLGVGDIAKMLVIFLGVSLPVIYHSFQGAKAVEEKMLWSGAAMGLSAAQRMVRIVLPAALPEILTGCRTGIVLALITMVTSEMIARQSGAGNILFNSLDMGQYDIVYAMIIIIGALGIGLDAAFERLRRRLVRWSEPGVEIPLSFA